MKKLALFLALVLMVTSLGIAPALAEDTVTIKVMTVDFGEQPEGTPIHDAWLAAAEKAVGKKVKFEIEYVNVGDYATKCQLMLSGGNLPDILTYGWIDYSMVAQAGDTGMFVNLQDYWDQLPNYSKAWEADPNAPVATLSENGKLYAFCNAQGYPDGNPSLAWGAAVRRDILNELGLEIPTSWEEFYQVAKAIKAAKPECYPIFVHEEWEPAFYGMSTSFRNLNWCYFNGTEFVWGPVEEGYKESLRYMNKFYTEGLISPDYLTHTQEDGIANIVNGDGYMVMNLWNGYVNNNNWNKTVPEHGWILIPFVSAGETIQEGDWMFNQITAEGWLMNKHYGCVINSESKVIDDCLKLLDWCYSDEAVDLFTWGIEGVSYEVAEDGTRYFPQDVLTGETVTGHPSLNGGRRAGIFPMQSQMYSAEYNNAANPKMPIYDIFTGTIVEEAESAYAARVYDAKYSKNPDPTYVMSADDSDETSYIWSLLQTVTNQWMAKFISGDADIDADWDAYLKDLENTANAQELVDIYNKYVPAAE